MNSPKQKWNDVATRVLEGDPLTREEAREILDSPDTELLSITDAAFRVRHRYHGVRVRVHILQNAKSGVCSEDCSFCSQSVRFKSPVDRYPMESVEQLVEGAEKAYEMGAVTYCMVTSSRGPDDLELDRVREATRVIKERFPLKVCASLGLLEEGQAEALVEAGVDRYNHNLESSSRYFPEVCGTHSFQDRIATIRAAREAGMEACSGGIMGMGETLDDRIDLAFTLRELDVESVPVNFLNARPNTPFEDVPQIPPTDCLRALAMFRLVHPDKDVRAAGGREICLGSLQPLALYSANSIFTNGYLTTPGAEPSDDWKMITEAGFEAVVAEEEKIDS